MAVVSLSTAHVLHQVEERIAWHEFRNQEIRHVARLPFENFFLSKKTRNFRAKKNFLIKKGDKKRLTVQSFLVPEKLLPKKDFRGNSFRRNNFRREKRFIKNKFFSENFLSLEMISQEIIFERKKIHQKKIEKIQKKKFFFFPKISIIRNYFPGK